MITTLSQCMNCRHLQDGKPMHCTAFPDKIPRDIIFGDFDHRRSHEGDHGIQYEPLEGEEHIFAPMDRGGGED